MPKRVQKRADSFVGKTAGGKTADCEVAYVTEEFAAREKHKARLLRKTQWWKAKCAPGICYYCNSVIAPSELTMDHIIPVSRGGMSVKSNIAPACKACNDRKKHTLPHEWALGLESLNQRSGV
ncbi:MAG: HNH endonuclease [Nitrospirae bacterium]|nr:HNH endonuclease [Nitrospirota bacterium]